MKSAFARDAMVTRVNGIFDIYRTFMSLPEVDEKKAVAGVTARVLGTTQQQYIEALYEVCAEAIPIGRYQDRIVGTPVETEDRI